MDSLNISQKYGKAEQTYRLTNVMQKRIGDTQYEIFQSERFFSRPVTFGTKIEVTEDTVRVLTKAAICSEEDNYNPQLGREIVLGRLVIADEQEGTVMKNDPDGEFMRGVVENIIKQRARQLAKYITDRSAIKELHRMSAVVANRQLREQFESFK